MSDQRTDSDRASYRLVRPLGVLLAALLLSPLGELLLCQLGATSSLLPTTRADVRLAALFSDHAVLQRERPLPVWGWAEPGEEVQVRLQDVTARTTTTADGRWQVNLPPQAMSKKPVTLEVTGRNQVTLRDILIGDVWLCSGQSNMEWGLGGCDAPDDIRQADLPTIRHFGVEMNFAMVPQRDVRGRWLTCSPQTAPGFTAVGFYFARRIQQDVDVPIGLLRSSVGGTNIELWMSQQTLMETPALAEYGKVMRASLATYQNDLATAIPTLEGWISRARQAQQAGQPLPLPPAMPEFPFGEKMFRPRCVTLHNGMIAPLIPFALRGALWYQGENNAGNAADGEQYLEKKRALLKDWRSWFGDPELPFYFVQLAAWQKPSQQPAGGDGWSFIRDTQRKCLTLPYTGMAVAIDIGDADDIHPHNKADVGERLARWALANQYGQKLEPSGPLFRELQVDGARAIVRFDHVGAGLTVGKKSGRAAFEVDAAGQLQRFAIAGKDRQWRWATARIEGDTVVCTHPDIPEPVAVRYAFTMNPAGANLYNRDGLPASPFRTDNW